MNKFVNTLNKLRAFLALNINNNLKEKIAAHQEQLKNILIDYPIKWENPDKFHMTVRFLGDVEQSVSEGIINKLSGTSFDFDKLLFFSESIDFFPNKRRPNVIFLGLKEENNSSKILVDEIDKVISKFGIMPDKSFVPHITMGRFRRENRKSIKDKIFPKIEKMKFEFDRFYFMKSVMDSKGSNYFVLKDFLFKN